MVNEVTASSSNVYKLAFGTDSAFVNIFNSTTAQPFNFIVDGNTLYFGNGTDMKKYDGTTVSNWGITAPSVAPTITPTGTGLTGDYSWLYCYYNSLTGHISSPSPVSATTTLATNRSADISATASTDTQVTGIKVFRTTAGGGGIFFEITGSPFINATGVYRYRFDG
jgi:hypothetical protein